MTPSSASYLPGTPGGQPMTPGTGGLDMMSPVLGKFVLSIYDRQIYYVHFLFFWLVYLVISSNCNFVMYQILFKSMIVKQLKIMKLVLEMKEGWY